MNKNTNLNDLKNLQENKAKFVEERHQGAGFVSRLFCTSVSYKLYSNVSVFRETNEHEGGIS